MKYFELILKYQRNSLKDKDFVIYPTAMIRAKKKDQVVAIPPNR